MAGRASEAPSVLHFLYPEVISWWLEAVPGAPGGSWFLCSLPILFICPFKRTRLRTFFCSVFSALRQKAVISIQKARISCSSGLPPNCFVHTHFCRLEKTREGCLNFEIVILPFQTFSPARRLGEDNKA